MIGLEVILTPAACERKAEARRRQWEAEGRTLNRRVEQFLMRSRMPPSRFGRLAAKDPRLVFDMRCGRELRSATAARVAAFIEANEPERV